MTNEDPFDFIGFLDNFDEEEYDKKAEVERLSALEVLASAIRFYFIDLMATWGDDGLNKEREKDCKALIELSKEIKSTNTIMALAKRFYEKDQDVIVNTKKAAGKYLDKKDDRVCGRCGGQGHILGYQHISNGVCFACGGTGVKR